MVDLEDEYMQFTKKMYQHMDLQLIHQDGYIYGEYSTSNVLTFDRVRALIFDRTI